MKLDKYFEGLSSVNLIKFTGYVNRVVGLTIESTGPNAKIGELCEIYPNKDSKPIKAEVVGFKEKKVLLMPLGEMAGIAPGSKVVASGHYLRVNVGDNLLGRVLDGLGNVIDAGTIPFTHETTDVNNQPPNPLLRDPIDEPLTLGVKAIDSLITCGKGQRMGIFAGSGVGKSTLLGMIARNTSADINVIALIGERGREVREFIEHDLGKEGLKRSVLVVATSDQPALVRLKGAQIATAIAEYFRDKGKDVLLMMDSLTRFSMAQREVGLAVGEPPVTRGYTPSVFALLPKLLERAGRSDKGSITGLYTVLVDGDDFNEPISDTVRGILDGHILLSRKLATLGRYPAIDVLGSISRVMPKIVTDEHLIASRKMREFLAVYNEAEDLINIGAYKRGSSAKIDEAIDKNEACVNFLKQDVKQKVEFQDCINEMQAVVD